MLGYHKARPIQISVHPTKQLALSFSERDCFIWETDTWAISKKLEGESGGFQWARFSPSGKYITTSFMDSSVYIFVILIDVIGLYLGRRFIWTEMETIAGY
jgi:WD40 repeat protein